MPPDLSVDSIDAQRVSDRALSKAAPANESRNLNRSFDELITKAGDAAFASTTCGTPAPLCCLRRTCQREW
jgi:hypothetical protein